MPRPDETCLGNQNIPSPYGSPCKYHYLRGGKHECKLFDSLKKIMRQGSPPKGLLDKLASDEKKRVFDIKDTIRDFYVWCIVVNYVQRGSVYSDVCIKCGDCCVDLVPGMNEFAWYSFRNVAEQYNNKHPRDANVPVGWVCENLEYRPELDNGATDLGMRCKIYGTTIPPECKEFPNGKEWNCYEEWLEGREIKPARLPRCTFKFEIVLP